MTQCHTKVTCHMIIYHDGTLFKILEENDIIQYIIYILILRIMHGPLE